MDLNSRTIYADLFPLDTTEEDVRRLFAHFGKVKHVNLPTFNHEHPLNKGYTKPRSRGYAFIEFQSKLDVELACSFFNDLRNTQVKHGQPENEAGPEQLNHSQLDRDKLLKDPNHVKLTPLRVMPKSTYINLATRYDELRFQSLMKTAIVLTIPRE